MNTLGFHRIKVEVTHIPSSQYKVQKVVNVPGINTEVAKENAKMYFIKLGYEVHYTEYLSIM